MCLDLSVEDDVKLNLAFKLRMAVQRESFRNKANKYKITGFQPSFLSQICSNFNLPRRIVVSNLENGLVIACGSFFFLIYVLALRETCLEMGSRFSTPSALNGALWHSFLLIFSRYVSQLLLSWGSCKKLQARPSVPASPQVSQEPCAHRPSQQLRPVLCAPLSETQLSSCSFPAT